MDMVDEVPVIEITLEEALDRLGAESPDLAQAQAELDAAKGVARQAAAAWHPIVAVQGGYTRNDREVLIEFDSFLDDLPIPIEGADELTPILFQPLDVWQAAGSVELPLFVPSAWAQSTAARRGVAVAEGTVEEAALALELGLVSAAASVQAAEGVAGAAQRAQGVAAANLRSTEVARSAGTATKLDVLAAKADLARRRSAAVQAAADVASAREALGGLLGVDGQVAIRLPDLPPPGGEEVQGGEEGEGGEEGDVAGTADADRPALRAAAAAVGAASAQVAAARWRAVPSVTASAVGLVQDELFPTDRRWAYRLGLEATWTLYDGGLRIGQAKEARAHRRRAEAELEAETLRVAREIRSAQREVDIADQRLELAQEEHALATAAAEIAQRGLAAGTVTPQQARETEQRAFDADVGVAAARAQLTVAWAALRRARGRDQRW